MSPEGIVRLLIFELDTVLYALPFKAVQEVAPMATLLEPAVRPRVLRGFLRLDANLVPVLDLRELFARPSRPPGAYTPLIVLQKGRLALMVDRLVAQRSLPATALTPVEREHSFNGCIVSEFDSIAVLSPDALLLEQERQCIADLQQVQASRLSRLP